MKCFAKLYEYDDIGQVLVKSDTSADEYEPEVRLYFIPDSLGVCSIALSYDDTDDGYDKRDTAFNNMTKERAYGLCKKAIDHYMTKWISVKEN